MHDWGKPQETLYTWNEQLGYNGQVWLELLQK